MELLSNLAWLLVTGIVLGRILMQARRSRTARISTVSMLLLAGLICLLLLPVVSLTDDLLQAHQAALPISGQSWRLASEGASVGLELASLLSALLLLLVGVTAQSQRMELAGLDMGRSSLWLTESLRRRPPPCAAR